jgi:hypothetical protein
MSVTEGVGFERPKASEAADIAEIVRGILAVQARFGRIQHRLPGRGTHTKGVCLRGTFEVFDLSTRISDPQLAARLARGVFVKPGVYPATIRFANAASLVQRDSKPDVRALSFAIDVPAGVVAPQAQRLDFSMNDATTFPINDAHAFASFMRVKAAGSGWAQLKAFLGLPWPDKREFMTTARLGLRQVRGGLHPYQLTRFWSTVPFLHGTDQAVKYSAIPAPSNAARPVGRGASVLRDELLRHVTQDAEMSSFDFGLQLLDVDRMTFKGERREPSFWVENAAVEWNERESPFHIVGRLTLERASILHDDDCRRMYIDVTEHSTADTRPIGSINRARWAAESESRRARFKAASEAAPATVVVERPDLLRRAHRVRRWIGGIRVRTVARVMFVLIVLGFAGLAGLIYYLSRQGSMLPAETIDQVLYADQGWGPGVMADARQTYYYTAQGAGLKDLRYSWFVHLEMPFSRTRIADPSVMRRYGFIVDGPSEKNPHGLPVGFSKHFDRELNEELLDITCAACHTGQLNVTRNGRTTAIRIDGGSAMHAFTDSNPGHFVPTLFSSLMATAANPIKFRRFARNVLGDHSLMASIALHRQMMRVVGKLGAMAYNERKYALVPTEEGYGRTDALARIANTVFAEHVDSRNYDVGDAPVNYPPVWNIWKFDWVQYNASVSQPMARNIGETMGTGAKYALLDRYGRPLPPDQRYRSSALLLNLHTIETTLRKLRPPSWPEDALGAIDRAKAERGRQLFAERCAHCHGPFNAPPALKARNAPLKTADEPEWIVKTVCVGDIGTDPNTAVNFAGATVDLTRTGLTADDLRRIASHGLSQWKERQTAYLTSEIGRLKQGGYDPAQLAEYERELAGMDAAIAQELSNIDPSRLPVGLGLSYLGTMIREKAYEDLGIPRAQQAELDGFGALDRPQVVAAYKPRPLAGIWASPPFLHNGSVPTIYDLLSPPDERPTTFRVGSREFDPVKVGLAPADERYWLFDTSLDGNSNRGHAFTGTDWTKGQKPQNGRIGPYLPPEDRLAIIEHLKVRNDDVDAPSEGYTPTWGGCPPPAPRRAAAR